MKAKEDFLEWEYFGPKLLEIRFDKYDEADVLCREFLILNT